MTETRTRSELLELWRDALTNGADVDPADAVIDELADYFGVSRDEAAQRCAEFVRFSDEEWNDRARETPDDLIDFWNRHSPVYGILMSHALQYHGEHPASCVDIAEALAGRPTGKMLDFGVGPATSTLFFSELGWAVTAADVSPRMLDVARWRLDRRGVEVDLLDLRNDPLPECAFDVVVALEVMAHVPDIPATIDLVRSTLRPGGMFVFNVFAPPDNPSGHLFVGNHHVIRHVRRAGFARHPRIAGYYMYERVESSPRRRALVGAVDALRHNRLVSDAAQYVRRTVATVRR